MKSLAKTGIIMANNRRGTTVRNNPKGPVTTLSGER